MADGRFAGALALPPHSPCHPGPKMAGADQGKIIPLADEALGVSLGVQLRSDLIEALFGTPEELDESRFELAEPSIRISLTVFNVAEPLLHNIPSAFHPAQPFFNPIQTMLDPIDPLSVGVNPAPKVS